MSAAAPRTSAHVWAVLVGLPALVVACLWGLYAWSVRVDQALLAAMRETETSLAPGSDWRRLRVPRAGDLDLCLRRSGAPERRACACVSVPPGDPSGRAERELGTAERDAAPALLAEAARDLAGCDRLVLVNRRFIRYQRLEVGLVGDRVRDRGPLYPGPR